MADVPGIKPNALVASAKILTAEPGNKPRKIGWQDECWDMYDVSGELGFAAMWLSNAISRARLFAAVPPKNPGDEPTPLESGAAVDLVEQFGGGVIGQSGLLASLGVHLTVPGVGYLVGATEDEETSWRIYSTDTIRLKKTWEVQVDEKDWRPLPEEALLVKIWRHHERKHWLADSPTRHALPVLREIMRCNEHIDATLVSRLAGAGLLLLPDQITFPVTEANKNKEDPFIYELIEQMTAPIRDRGTASAIVPLPVRMNGDFIDKVKHLTFHSPLDDKVLDTRERAIRRFATTVDFPADILLGLSGMNHWGAWQVEESAVKIHVDPFLQTIVYAFTAGYLRPALEALGEDPQSAMIWFDTSELSVRPDKSKTGVELYDRMTIGPGAMLRESGFDASDAPTADELEVMAYKQMLKEPNNAPIGLAGLGIPIRAQPERGSPGLPPPPDAPLPENAPNTPPTPEGEPPGPQPDVPASLLASVNGQGTSLLLVSDQIVHRALERAGNRIRTLRKGRLGPDEDCPPVSMHECVHGIGTCELDAEQLLLGAWDRVGDVAPYLHVDADQLARALNRYCTSLLLAGQAHSLDNLAGFLAVEPV